MLSDYEGSILPQASMNQGRKTETDKKYKSVQKNKIGKEGDQLDVKCLTSRYISHALLFKKMRKW